MNKFKILTIAGIVLSTAAILCLVYIVAFKNPKSSNTANSDLLANGITYTNEEFGYSLTLPSSWKDYKVSQAEESIMLYIPATGTYKDWGFEYGPIIYVTAVPLSEVAKQEVLCKTPDENRHWSECAGVNNSIGGNNAYRFYTAFVDDYMPGYEEEGKAVQGSIRFFNVNDAPEYRVFRSIQKDFDYEFEYPTNTFKATYGKEIFLPYESSKSAYSQISLYHEIPVEYCGASGECTPTTDSMEVGSIVLEDTIEAIKKSSIGKMLSTKTYGLNTALVLSQGAEGEGMEYHFLEMPNNKVLLVYYRYINEEVVLNYKNVKDFIPYKQQTKIVDDILRSIKQSN